MRTTYRLSSAVTLFLMAAAAQAQTLTPSSVTLKPSQTQQFSITNAGKEFYEWSLSSNSGTLSTSGLYKAPASITAISTVIVYAIFPGHPTLSATVTLMPQVSISVSPTWISMTNGQSAAFNATVTGATNTAVTWSYPAVGSITPGGVYTVPTSLNTQENISVTATSQVDPTKSATITIALVPSIGVSLNPTSTSLTGGQSTSLNPTVTGTTNMGLNWSLSPQVGTISNGVYTAPSAIASAQTVTVTAASQASTGTTASVTLSLVPPLSISVTPTSKTLTSGQSATFTASVTGTSNNGVNWSLSPAVGSISNGVYTAPALVTTSQSVTVKATSAADSTKSATAIVSLTPSVSISMTPSSASLTAGQSSTFKATVSGSSNTSVDWSMSPSLGTLAAGVYTAPATIASAQTVTVTAASAADPTKNVSAHVSLVPVAVTVSPTAASLTGGQSTTLKATVTGSSNTTVNWSVSPAVGTIAGGVYTAPATVASAQSVTVKATSAADATKSASATIALSPVGITVSPSAASLSQGQSATLTATVTGSSNTGVNWSLSPSVGTLANGVYTAPASIASAQTVTATASSMADPTKTASATISLTPPAPAVSISVTPTTASLTGGQSATFAASVTGSSNLGVNWTLSPPVGTLTNGVYTAPALISLQQTVMVAAASAADPTKIASASITLLPTVSVSVAPTTVSLTPSQSQQFSASLSGTTNPNVTWSMSPNVGSLGSGLYQAPATINSQQTVTVTATSLADPTKTGSATITLVPTVGIALTPSSISLTGGQSNQFNVSIGGVPSTAVTWALAPSVGTITNGVYTAPVTINALQTIVLTVASIANPAQTATANITLTASTAPAISVSPGVASLNPSGSQQFTATGLGTNPIWTISPTTGTITAGGLYSAPSSVTVQSTITITATSATDSTKSATATVTLNPASSQTPPTTTTLPIEVMGPDGTTVAVSFNIPSGTNLSGSNLWMQIHGLRYATQASVQINGGAWQPISEGNVTLLGLASTFGGIGGGFHTISMTMPTSAITTGTNTLTFRFNGTNGVSSGYRVLSFNVLDANSNQLVPQSSFTWDDPSTWQPPSSNPSDITAGQTLWNTANLTVPGTGAIKAHCSDCHAQDGRDLKYFNYSNNSIHVRSVFHGLTPQQGDQIASYIRSLNSTTSTYSRPWNPPYQPGPGMDSRPVSDWAAGAGLDAILNNDSEMLPFLMPGGSTANWAHNANLNQRELPIPLQLADWNHWLPTIHPMDSFGATFTNSELFALYQKLRSELVPNSTTAYSRALSDMRYWAVRDQTLTLPLTPAPTDPKWQDPVFTNSMYSIRLWSLVKLWELNQEFGLEGMAAVAFGPQSESRAWYSNMPFITFNVPFGSLGIGNNLPITLTYDHYRWYHLQLLLNDGNGTAEGTWPIDWAYALGFPSNNLTWDAANRKPIYPDGALLVTWLVKGLQGLDRLTIANNGWSEYTNDPGLMVDFPGVGSLWSNMSPVTKVSIMNAYLQAWLTKAVTFSPQAWYTSTYSNQTVQLNQTGSQYTTRFAKALPQFRFEGVDATLLDQFVTMLKTNWPGYNWSGALNASCALSNIGEVQCTIPTN
jgi:hypothetical protein